MKIRLLIFNIILLLVAGFSCKKTPEIPSGNIKIGIGETIVDTASYFDAIVISSVISTNNNNISQHGHCWDTSESPILENIHTSLGAIENPDTFTSSLNNLLSQTKYYVRSYFDNGNTIIYGAQKSFTTLKTGKPITSTSDVSEITLTNAICGGTVVADSGYYINSKGVCWDTVSDFNINNCISKTTDGDSLGSFTSEVTGLHEGQTYYIKAYATNENGTSYGKIEEFTTIPITLSELTTMDVTEITINSALSGGDITNAGNGTITERGLCWNITGNPTLYDNISYTNEGSGVGSFSSHITGLVEQTIYYVTAYATNEKGTAYGNTVSFISSSGPCEGQSSFEYEGQTYNIVVIGGQCWMKENLNIGIRIDGDQNQTNNSQIEKYCYNDNEANCDIYGGLYQWDEIMNYIIQEGTQGICPDGWHIPTYNEFELLSELLGGDDLAGGKLKETGTVYWNPPNLGASNISGFTALPSGVREHSQGIFVNKGNNINFWSSTNEVTLLARSKGLQNTITKFYTGYVVKKQGSSIRCIRN